MTYEILAGIMIPFLGTTIGAAAALLCKKSVSPLINTVLCGFAAGVMIAASIWSLIMPSVEMSEGKSLPSFFPAALGFMIGVVMLIVIDTLLPSSQDRKNKMLFLAVTVHNVPEGMAVGAIFAGLMSGAPVTFAVAMSLSIGIAMQNIPEGAIVGLPIREKGRLKAFLVGTASGAVEPIAALITIALYVVAVAVLPYLLSFAAGAMIYVAVKELVPELNRSNAGIVGLSVGFVIMMIMDLAL